VYQLAPRGSGWIFTILHAFQGGSDGDFPQARVVFGPEGKLYGTTSNGGNRCGTVFTLTPPPRTCESAGCSWTKTVIHNFSQSDGCWPGFGDLTFDGAEISMALQKRGANLVAESMAAVLFSR